MKKLPKRVLLMELEMSKGKPRFCEECGVFLFPFESSGRCYVCDGVSPWSKESRPGAAETVEEEGRGLVLKKIESSQAAVGVEGACSG